MQLTHHGKAARFLFGGAGLLLVFSACSDSSSPSVGSAIANTTTIAAVAPSVADPAAATTTAAPAAQRRPQSTGPRCCSRRSPPLPRGYHFNQTATVDGVVALTVDGDRLTDGARLAVSNEAGLVFYVITPTAPG